MPDNPYEEDASLDQILITMGGYLFAGNEISDIDTHLLNRTHKLIEEELLNRGHVPIHGALH